MNKLFVSAAAMLLAFGLAACGGSKTETKDASDTEQEGQKSLEKFEGNKMEKADGEEDAEATGEGEGEGEGESE
jgi:hypothetical protein